MEIYRRKVQLAPSESAELRNRVNELEVMVTGLKEMLAYSKMREKRLVAASGGKLGDFSRDLDNMEFGSSKGHYDEKLSKIKSDAMNIGHDIAESSLLCGLQERVSVLLGLLVFQSCSSFILAANEGLLSKHPAIIYFLTMLVGTAGNAGNQAAVRVIRGIALGTLSKKTYGAFLKKECIMAVTLSLLLGFLGLLRAIVSFQASYSECIAISATLCVIVLVSVVLGSLLPIGLHLINIDPAHSSTGINVLMDILGVFITCFVSTLLLDSNFGQYLLNIDAAFGGSDSRQLNIDPVITS